MALSPEKFNRLLQLAKSQPDGVRPPQRQGVLGETATDLKEGFLGVGEDLFKRGENLTETVQEGARGIETGEGQTPFETAGQVVGQVLGGAADIIGGVVTTGVKAVLPQRTEEKGVEFIAEKADQFGITEALRELEEFKVQNPRAGRNISAAQSTLEFLADRFGLGVAKKGGQVATEAVETGVTKAKELVPKNIKIVNDALPIKTKEAAVDSLTDAYQKSFVSENKSIINKLETQANRASFGTTKVTSAQLVRELAQEGYIPRVDGKLARFDDIISDLELRRATIAKAVDPVIDRIPELSQLDDLARAAEQVLRTSPQIGVDLNKSLSELKRAIDSLKNKHGDVLEAKTLNEVIKQANQKTKAFKGDQFELDVSEALARASRQRLKEIAPPSVGLGKEQIGKLFELEKTARIFNNQPINVGVLGGQLGRYIGVIGAAPLGFAAAGPGGLVVAGIAAHMGAKAVAALMRKNRFSPKRLKILVDGIKKDKSVVDKLISEAKGADKALLKRLLLPEGAIPLEAPKNK